MHCKEIASFDVVHRSLAWPWIALDPSQTRFVFASSERGLATRVLAAGAVDAGPSFPLPEDLALPTVQAPPNEHRGVAQGVHGFAIDPSGDRVAVVGTTLGKSVLVTIEPSGETMRSRIDALVEGDFVAHAVAFDRTGSRLWVSAESGEATALVVVDARTHARVGAVLSAPFPPPAFHELHPHPVDDAVLLLAACGQDGTFARVAGWSDGPPVAIPTALDDGAAPAGFVGFSSDGARVHLAADDELRTHAWPTLETLSTAPFADDFVSSYSGVLLGGLIFVDGQLDLDRGEEEAVMTFDRAALKGSLAKPPVPAGMWVGRLGTSALVTVEAKGDPARGRVVVLREVEN
jgi:hypothetical protein